MIEKRRSIFDDQVFRTVVDQLYQWSKKHELGTCLTEKYFLLPNQAVRNAAIAWVSTSRLVNTVRANHGMTVLCPDFVVEFRSRSDDLKTSKAKMKEWVTNGCCLGWLIDEKKQVVYIFEKSRVRMAIGFDKALAGEPVLPGFVLDLSSRQLPAV